MKITSGPRVAAFLLLAAMGSFPLLAQEDVTISKNRLKELEAKEKELEKLKGGQAVPATPVVPQAASAPAQAVPPMPARQSPPLASLPPMKPGETVEAADLANYYRLDRASADLRFRKQKIVVRGEIAGFDKPILRRNYRVILAGPDRDSKVTCDLMPPEKYSAVFTVSEGSELVGLQGETRIPLAKVGTPVLVEGTCKGLRGTSVFISGISLKTTR